MYSQGGRSCIAKGDGHENITFLLGPDGKEIGVKPTHWKEIGVKPKEIAKEIERNWGQTYTLDKTGLN